MTEPTDLVQLLLREIRAKLDDLSAKVEDHHQQTQVALASIEMHQVAFMLTLNSHGESLRALESRLQRIERRMELTDEAPP